MAEMIPGDQVQSIYIGTGKAGSTLRQTLNQLAAKHKGGSLSRLLIDAVIEIYGIDRETGNISPGRPTGVPRGQKQKS